LSVVPRRMGRAVARAFHVEPWRVVRARLARERLLRAAWLVVRLVARPSPWSRGRRGRSRGGTVAGWSGEPGDGQLVSGGSVGRRRDESPVVVRCGSCPGFTWNGAGRVEPQHATGRDRAISRKQAAIVGAQGRPCLRGSQPARSERARRWPCLAAGRVARPSRSVRTARFRAPPSVGHADRRTWRRSGSYPGRSAPAGARSQGPPRTAAARAEGRPGQTPGSGPVRVRPGIAAEVGCDWRTAP
jgi:hypothetical protein